MRRLLILVALTLVPVATAGQADNALMARVKQERGAYLKTLQELVSIESGSRDIDGLNRISEVIASRLRALGGTVGKVNRHNHGDANCHARHQKEALEWAPPRMMPCHAKDRAQ